MIKTEIKRLDLRHPWTISRNTSHFKENVFVRIERDGIVGWGEAAPNVRYKETAALTLERISTCADELSSQDFHQYAAVKAFVDVRILDQGCARAAIDQAIMDWVCKAHGLSLAALWGISRERDSITSYSIGIDAPDVLARKVAEAEAYPVLKIKLGSPDDRALVETLRAITDKPLYVDANEGWTTVSQAREMCDWLQEMGVLLVEQPMPAAMLVETLELRRRASLPIIADEAVLQTGDIHHIADAYDGINVKLMKAGGLQEARLMIDLARRLGLKVMLGCMVESSLAISAAAQLAPLADWVDLDGNLLLTDDPFEGVKVEQGRLIYNDLPGLGAVER